MHKLTNYDSIKMGLNEEIQLQEINLNHLFSDFLFMNSLKLVVLFSLREIYETKIYYFKKWINAFFD